MSDDRSEEPRVAVVGAGITGLTTVHFLAARGVDVVAFDADRKPGGVIRSRRIDGRVLEYGPQRIRQTSAVRTVIEDLDLEDEVIAADPSLPLYVYADGSLRKVPRSPRAFLRTDLLSWRAKLRVLYEPVTASGSGEELAGGLLERKFGTEAYENILEPLVGGIYAGDPAEMPADPAVRSVLALEERHGSLLRAALSRWRAGGKTPAPITFEDGLQTLPRALYRRHEPYVHLNTPVESIVPVGDASAARTGESTGTDGRYEIVAGGRKVEADAVIVTIPARDAASVLESLGEATVRPLRDLRYNSLVLVHLAAETGRVGFGYQIRRDEGFTTRGVTWNEGLFGRDGVHTAFLGGASDPGALDRSTEELGRQAAEEFEAVMGAEAEVLEVTRLPEIVPAYDASWRGLGAHSLPDGVVLATNYTGRIGVPSRIREARQVADRLADSLGE